MRERRGRKRPIKGFRHEALDDDRPEGAPPPEIEGEQIVVHVHVHRDGDGKLVVNAATAAGPPRAKGAPAPRPTLTGQLFDWKSHYDVVARRHVEAGLRPPTLWTLASLMFSRRG